MNHTKITSKQIASYIDNKKSQVTLFLTLVVRHSYVIHYRVYRLFQCSIACRMAILFLFIKVEI